MDILPQDKSMILNNAKITNMKSIKVNHIESTHLSEAEMAHLKGGANCGCSCRFADSGGLSTVDNKNANAANGWHSLDMLHFTGRMNEDGT